MDYIPNDIEGFGGFIGDGGTEVVYIPTREEKPGY